MKKTPLVVLAWTVSMMMTSQMFAADIASYQVTDKISLEGDGGWDYLTLDPAARQLYISHATQVLVFDVDQKKVTGKIANTSGIHGVALAPAAGHGFTSNGKENTVTMFDLKTHAELARTSVEGQNPDAIIFDPASNKIFTFNGKSGDASVIDPVSAKVVGHVALGGKPEFAVADGQGLIFNNLEDKSELLAIDSKNLKVKERWPLAPCEEPSSMAFDAAHRRLFIGCGNQKMAVVNADNGHVITTLPIGDHVDATVFDSANALIFNACGDGTITLIHEDSPDTYRVAGHVTTQKGARTIALDPKTHKLYLVTAQFGPTPAPTAETPRPRPTILPSTFSLLVVSQKG